MHGALLSGPRLHRLVLAVVVKYLLGAEAPLRISFIKASKEGERADSPSANQGLEFWAVGLPIPPNPPPTCQCMSASNSVACVVAQATSSASVTVGSPRCGFLWHGSLASGRPVKMARHSCGPPLLDGMARCRNSSKIGTVNAVSP